MGLLEILFGFSDEIKAKHPHMFIHRNIDRRQCHRVVPMKVLCLGMGRTGTASMKAALEQLGYPTSHGFDLHENPKDADMWNEAIDVKWYGTPSPALDHLFWDKLLGHVSAVTDFPANMFGPELIAAYPDAKVILVERDVDAWYPSFEHVLIQSQEHPLVTSLIGQLDPKIKDLGPLATRGLMRGQFRAQNTTEWRRNAKAVYTQHYADIAALLAHQPERLLHFRLDQGWEPLCRFLGVGVPDTPFPRVNETKQHDEMMAVAIAQIARTILVKLLLWGGPIVAVVGSWFWLRPRTVHG